MIVMANDKILRSHVLALLEGGNAHVTFDKAVEGFPASLINENLPNVPYSAWRLLEHMRITQHDILDFITNPDYEDMEWPQDYWPPNGKKGTIKDWKKTVAAFKKDSKELQDIVRDPKTDLYAKIPKGNGQTILREALLVADHSAYHLGEFVVVRRMLKSWR
jgi:hypothetical protein